MFSMQQPTEEQKGQSNDYKKGFEDFMGGQENLTDKEKKILAEQAKTRQKEMAKETIRMSELKEEIEKQKQQDFEDIASGKAKAAADKSLQDIFFDYYSKVKEVDTSDYVNSAKKSLNSFSSILERRREKFKEGVKESKDADK